MELREVAKIENVKILWNLEEAKKEVTEYIEQFKDRADIEDDEAKKIKAELNKKIAGIEEFRKRIEKEYTKPISKFKEECEELKKIINNVLIGFEKQVDEAKKKWLADREEEISVTKNSLFVKHELEPKYSNNIIIDKKMYNKTTKSKDIEKFIEEQILIILDRIKMEAEAEQKRVEKIKVIEKLIAGTGLSITQIDLKMEIPDIMDLVERYKTKKLKEEQEKLQKQKEELEKKEKENIKVQNVSEIAKEKTIKPAEKIEEIKVEPKSEVEKMAIAETGTVEKEAMTVITLELAMTKEKAKMLLEFLKENNIYYKKVV